MLSGLVVFMSVVGLKEYIRNAVVNMFRVNMALKPGERVLVVTDYPTKEHWRRFSTELLGDIVERRFLARLVYDIAVEEFRDNEVGFLTYPLTGRHGAEPPSYVGDEMSKHHVVTCSDSYNVVLVISY